LVAVRLSLRAFPFGRFGWFGTRAQTVALITWALPLVVLIVRARLLGLDVEQEAMAADLGGPPSDVVRRVLAPQLLPAILASAVAVFAGVMGEFILMRALVGDVASAPLALSIGTDNSPHDDAVATTLALAGSIAFVAVLLSLRSTAKVHGWIRR
jgi:spermidine/putrescine transport system permease protein